MKRLKLIPVLLRESQEFQSAMIRMAVWVFMAGFVGIAGWTQYYDVNWTLFYLAFGFHLFWYVGILVHVIRHPQPLRGRRYLALLSDVSGTTFSILLGGDPETPFYLLYVWIFISQGMRYGKNHLVVASAGSILGYSLILTMLDGWQQLGMDSVFLLLILFLLPVYLYTLVHRLHDAIGIAEKANQARGLFLATMTHELRTPLANLESMNDRLMATRLDLDQQDYVGSVGASVSQLQALIGDILDLSKIDANKLELEALPFEVETEILAVCRSLTESAVTRGLELTCDVDLAVPETMVGDKLRFRQILFNLIGNAVKFTHQGRVSVRVSVTAAGHNAGAQLLIEVEDTGIGIVAASIKKIFDVFWQEGIATSRDYGGTGLGTTIAHDLVELMNGRIGVDSEPGAGSRFWVTLPLQNSAAHDPALATNAAKKLAGYRVLILEPDPVACRLLTEMCDHVGMRPTAIYGMGDFDSANHGGLTQIEVDLVILADSPQGRDIDDEILMLRRLLGKSVPLLLLRYLHRPRQAIASDTLILQKPIAARPLWAAAIELLTSEQSAAVPAAAPTETLSISRKILIAEDDQAHAKMLEGLLIKKGYDVAVVVDGKTALEVALDECFDLTLIDMSFPEMDGLTFVRQYRATNEHERYMPVLALTAEVADNERQVYLDAGVDECLLKSLAPAVLCELICQYV